MELYILRHGIAVARGTPGYEDDRLRPLTPDGERKMKRAAKGMLALGLEFDLILTSPYVRAKRTAEIVVKEFNAKNSLRSSDNLISEGDPSQLISELACLGLSSILIVGHEPYLSGMMSLLLTGDRSMNIAFKKGGLCKLIVENLSYGKCAMLEWLMTPRQMIEIGK
jgi:phosphohistidine phosphatase